MVLNSHRRGSERAGKTYFHRVYLLKYRLYVFRATEVQQWSPWHAEITESRGIGFCRRNQEEKTDLQLSFSRVVDRFRSTTKNAFLENS